MNIQLFSEQKEYKVVNGSRSEKVTITSLVPPKTVLLRVWVCSFGDYTTILKLVDKQEDIILQEWVYNLFSWAGINNK